MKSYAFEPNLVRASTLPSDWYTSAESLESEHAKIFPRTWNLIGRAEQVVRAGDYFTTKIGRENIVVVRDGNGELRGYFNVCRHRAGPVAVGEGNLSAFRCLYHGWTYDLEGRLRATPEFQGVESFDREEFPLPPIQVRAWGPLVFGAIAPKMSFEEYLGRIPEDLEYLDQLRDMQHFKTVDYKVQANWKTYVDNYLEPYHLPSVHPDLMKELDYRSYKTETCEWYSTQYAPAHGEARRYDGGDRPGAHYYWLFPNLMFNIYQGLLQTNLVIPTGIEECVVRFDWYARRSLSEEGRAKIAGIMKFSDQIQEEDAGICARVQENLRSISYSQGRFSAKRENGVHHFHGLVARMLND